jgi:hypothetical protein
MMFCSSLPTALYELLCFLRLHRVLLNVGAYGAGVQSRARVKNVVSDESMMGELVSGTSSSPYTLFSR